MLKYVFGVMAFFLSYSLLAQQVPEDIDFFWPMVGNTGMEDVDQLNSNFGDFRNTERFHNGLDVQATENATINPMTEYARVIYYGPTPTNANVYYAILQHVRVTTNGFEDIDNSYSVYIHLTTGLDPTIPVGSLIPRSRALANAHPMELGHLHLYYSTDFNNTTANVNDDAAINPLSHIDWADMNEHAWPRDTDPPFYPKLRHIYVSPSIGVTVRKLGYPNSDNDLRITENQRTFGDFELRYFNDDNETNNEYPELRLFMAVTGQNETMRLILRATEQLTDGAAAQNGVPHEIYVYIDQNEQNAPVFNEAYYSLVNDQIQAGRPNAIELSASI